MAARDELPSMRVTDPHGIGFDVKALDIENFGIRIWMDPDGGLRIESLRQERLRITVRDKHSITLNTDE